MPFSSAATSSVRVAMLPSASSMALPKSETANSSSFFSSSFLSSSDSQYAFFLSSLACSWPSNSTMLSIMVRTLSKLTFFPWSASTKKSRRGSASILRCRLLAMSACNACRRTSLPLALVCRSEGLGSVFLKSSRESSSLRILMVSARATSSSERVFCTTSHSAFFFSQFLSRSAKNFLSSSNDFVVSSKSSFKASISKPVCPLRSSLDSMA
mmetsp:Transcript_105793/g.257020  ORF Transcript_105793/g.257020 Transcript_105793/m.257020 type:complete len:212 (+) Transcript_105793:840-1475(+)